MDNNSMELMEIDDTIFTQYGLSWLSYLRPLFFFSVMVLLSHLVGSFNINIFYVGSVLAFLWLIYNLLMLRSIVLFTNEDGVWVFKGVFPWAKGVNGVRWRDVEEASYKPGFLGWVMKAYIIRVGHRFTRGAEIVLPYVRRGNEAVEHINELHSSYLHSGGEQ